ncbi:MAG: phosphotransacetylase [Christensenellales bacterium]
MSIIDTIKAKAKADVKHIVLPEGSEERTVQAARLITDQGIAKVTLIGKSEDIKAAAARFNVNVDDIAMIDPAASELYPGYCEKFAEMRAKKGVTLEQAQKTMLDPLFFAAMMVYDDKADGFVSGAINTTGNTLRPGLQIIKTAKGVSTVSSCFIMEVPNKAYGDNGVLVFGDCAVNIAPTAEQLAAIAISSAQSAKALCGMSRVYLSFSTRGASENVDRVAKLPVGTRELIQQRGRRPQADLVEKVGQLKSPEPRRPAITVFPDLQAGNIGYKLVQRLAGAEAIGPICQGFAKPINDLSRGCSVDDIVSVVAITAVQAQNM